MKLQTLLGMIDLGLRSRQDRYELNPPATTEEIRGLSIIQERIGISIPQELELWFSWHNGQNGGCPLMNEDNRLLLSTKSALEAWSFYSRPENDYLKPFEKTWFPLLSNGSGDYLVLELGKVNTGALIGYWHDDTDRPIEYSNLSDWANMVLSGLNSDTQKKTSSAIFIEEIEPVETSIIVSYKTIGKDLPLSKKLEPFTKLSLMGAVKAISAGIPLVWDLAESASSIERSQDITCVKKVHALLEENSLSPVIELKNNGDGAKVKIDFDSLEVLRSKCL